MVTRSAKVAAWAIGAALLWGAGTGLGAEQKKAATEPAKKVKKPKQPLTELQKLRKRYASARNRVNAMARNIQKQKDVAPLVDAHLKAVKARDDAVLAKMAAADEHKELAAQVKGIMDEQAKRQAAALEIDRQLAELSQKMAELQKQRKELLKKRAGRKRIAMPRQFSRVRQSLIRKDAELSKLDAAARQAKEALDATTDAKLAADPKAAKLIAERDRLKAEYEKLAPPRKPRGTRKPAAKKAAP